MRNPIDGLRGTLETKLGTTADGPTTDLYECPACRSMIINPASERCPQCESGTLARR